ncbi:MAG: thioredoxin family protein [Cytophagaceae bacterium]|nr:thioredoxin family protein [Cytophagaceae bacterium]
MKRLLILLLICIPFLGCSQPTLNNNILAPTRWTVTLSKSEVKLNEEVEVIITAEVQDDWYIYSIDVDDPRTNFTFTEDPSIKIIGKVKEGPGVKVVYSDIFDKNIRKYYKTAEFRQKIKILKTNPLIEVDIDGQSCSDINGQCVPFRGGKYKIEGIKVLSDNSVPTKTDTGKKVITNPETTKVDSPKVDTSEKVTAPGDTSTKTEVINEGGDDDEGDDEGNMSLITFLLLAFGGGLVSLLTPCVFPMVPLTVTFFLNASTNKAQAFKKAFLYGTSIVFIFTVIGLIISWTVGPSFATFLSNHWIPNLLFFLIFIIFGLSFLGMFEITLPSSFINRVDAKADKGGNFGIFFMALTLVLVSFSCTAPIVSPILIEASKGEAIRPVLGMLAYSSAFALPFTIFALFPTLLSKLPKSGGWMNVIKVTLGFIEVALAFKFLSAVDRVYHLRILDRDIFIGIWVAVAALLTIYLIGWIKLPNDDEVSKISVGRLMLAIVSFTFVIYLIPGMWGAPLRGLSGVLPPMSSHDFDVPGIIRKYSVKGEVLCDEPKYGKKYEMPHGLKGYFEYQQALKCAKEKNKPLFIDFTGLNCANCIRMEENVWADQEVLKILNEEYVLVSLYTDDPTALSKEEVYTSVYDKEEKATIGDRNLDIEIAKFNSNALPYYILLDPYTEKPLVKGVGFTPSVINYVNYLNKGTRKFKKLHPDK